MKKPEQLLTISLPENLIRELDHFRKREHKSRNQIVKEAIHFFMCEKSKTLMHEEMKNGYEEMGTINLALAEIGLCIEYALLENYEDEMPEWKEVPW
ncbi:ribbon-helix-helix domain-containing protein [Tindallia californiensis]|uniref:CopG family transcriptional regulator / antitoxin EndoAI n=1 Tax=Tindallia californiensis TaxID=159292 RepID=A0A1H3K4C3_9FIRM|nr:ribbon-helix-helix protein, CopG family [Tindallia californiensis]SDY47042.1 CopG family transcriptional regulator / antitoxin EndoAI [Tindallia californiensis]